MNRPKLTAKPILKAKNAFGAYIVKDVTFYLRQKKVVAADGL
jgi:hypothetical protein